MTVKTKCHTAIPLSPNHHFYLLLLDPEGNLKHVEGFASRREMDMTTAANMKAAKIFNHRILKCEEATNEN